MSADGWERSCAMSKVRIRYLTGEAGVSTTVGFGIGDETLRSSGDLATTIGRSLGVSFGRIRSSIGLGFVNSGLFSSGFCRSG